VNRGLSRDETFAKDLHDDNDIERELLRLVTRAAATCAALHSRRDRSGALA